MAWFAPFSSNQVKQLLGWASPSPERSYPHFPGSLSGTSTFLVQVVLLHFGSFPTCAVARNEPDWDFSCQFAHIVKWFKKKKHFLCSSMEVLSTGLRWWQVLVLTFWTSQRKGGECPSLPLLLLRGSVLFWKFFFNLFFTNAAAHLWCCDGV